MKRIFSLLIISTSLYLSCFAVSVADVSKVFTGSLSIGGEPYNNKEIYILPGSKSGHVTMVLPNFEFSGISLGDIIVVNIPMDTSGQLNALTTSVFIEILELRANVIVSSPSSLSSSLAQITLNIDVPDLATIPVTFSGQSITDRNYDFTNGGFEGSWSNNEPNGWHSFVTATGKMATFVNSSSGQFTQSSDKRPGSTGSHSALIKSKVLMGAKANGNCTNGQINAGATKASDGSKNYNFSDPSNEGYNTAFVGNPDSLVFWTKYIPADGNVSNSANKARAHAVVTTNARYQDPETSDYSSIKIADAAINYSATSSKGWQRLSVPFSYSSVNPASAAYVMITFSTNQTPGGGTSTSDNVDNVYLDDVEMVYNHALTSLTIDGQNVSFSNGVATSDLVYSDNTYAIEAKNNGKGAQSFIGYDEATASVYIYVVAHNYSQTPNYSLYTVKMVQPTQDNEYAYSASTCDNEPYSDANFTNLTQSDTYQTTLKNKQGGDSLITLTLTVLPSYSFPTSASIHLGETYTWHEKEYNYSTPGIYNDTISMQTAEGCDSLYTLTLHVTAQGESYSETLTTCQYEEQTWHEKSLPTAAAGTYTIYDSLISVYGVDSIHVLNLTVLPAYRSESNVYINKELTQYTWDGHSKYTVEYPNGVVYTEQNNVLTMIDGIYILTDSHPMANGCDSSVVLYLHRSEVPVTYGSYTTTFCEGEDFTYDGIQYSESFEGDVHLSMPNVYGGDSIVHLEVNVLPSPTTHEYQTITKGEKITWQGYDLSTFSVGEKELMISGYTEYGCDSTIVLHLTINPIATALDEMQSSNMKIEKVLYNGHLYIIRNEDCVYDLIGRKIK